MKLTTKTIARALLAGSLAFGLAACSQTGLVKLLIQIQIDKYWNDPAKKAEAEGQAETKLKQAIDSQLGGTEFEVPGPNPYLHHVKWATVELGDASPKIDIVGDVTGTKTSTNQYVNFEWTADWAKGNGAAVDVGLDMRSHSFFLGYEYPDHDLHIRNISANAKGKAAVVIPNAGGQSVASITLTGGSIALDATAEGWFWTVNISNQIKPQVNDKLLRDLIGKSIKLAFNAAP
jgi:hypothetical protein